MYNPYVEESEMAYFPVEAREGESTGGPSLSSLLSLKEALGKMGGLSAVSELFSRKKASASAQPSEKKVPTVKPQGNDEGFLTGLKEKLRLEDLDGGDILLVLILIYLMIEGDDKIELAITLGILAFLWYLDGKGKESQSLAEELFPDS